MSKKAAQHDTLFESIERLPDWKRVWDVMCSSQAGSTDTELVYTDSLRGLFHHSCCGVAVLDSEGALVAVNEKLRNSIGLSELEVLRVPAHKYVRQEDLFRFMEKFETLRTGERNFFRDTVLVQTKGDSCARVECIVHGVRNSSKELGWAILLNLGSVCEDKCICCPGTEGSGLAELEQVLPENCEPDGREATNTVLRHKSNVVLQLLADAVIHATDMHDLMRRLHSIVQTVMLASNFFVALVREDNKYVSFPYFVDEQDAMPKDQPVGEGLVGWVLETKAPVLANRSRLAQFYESGEQTFGSLPSCWLGVPLITRSSKLLGAVVVQSYDDHASYTEEDMQVLRLVSTHIAGAIERERAAECLRGNEELFRDMFQKHGAMMMLIDTQTLEIIEANDAWLAFYGYTRDDLKTLKISEINVLPEGELRQLIKESMKGTPTSYHFRHRLANGEVRDVQAYPSPMYSGGRQLTCSVIFDITEQIATEKARLESDVRYRSIFDHAGFGIGTLDRQGRLIEVNPRGQEILGRTAKELQNINFTEYNHPEDVERSKRLFDELMQGKRDRFDITKRYITGKGKIIWGHQTATVVRDADGNPKFAISLLEDITQSKEAIERLSHVALHDTLTNLPNRALFIERLNRTIARRKSQEDGYAVFILDLDRFKIINDSLGHIVGDKLISDVGERLQEVLGQADTLARFGGDEFAILVENVAEVGDTAQNVDRVREAMSRPFMLNGENIRVTASIGIVQGSENYESAEEVIRDADIAMYRAKNRGGNTFEVFDTTMHEQASNLLRLETDMHVALRKGQFELHYQPLICLNSGVVQSYEALIRWNHPDRGQIGPFEFIPVAEETGLIGELTEWVLHESVRHLSEWKSKCTQLSQTKVRVNLSAKCFSSTDILHSCLRDLEKLALGPNEIIFEITENLLLDITPNTLTQMHKIREMGAEFSIDDFGTGYSSFSYLRRLPISELKIDKSFTRNMESDEGDKGIVRSMIELGKNMALKVVAEGVETDTQAFDLQLMGCHTGQGYFYAKPMPASEIERLIGEKRVRP